MTEATLTDPKEQSHNESISVMIYTAIVDSQHHSALSSALRNRYAITLRLCLTASQLGAPKLAILTDYRLFFAGCGRLLTRH